MIEETIVGQRPDRPNRLYLYRPLTGRSIEYAMDLISEGAVFVPSPKNFNDPFDCALPLDFSAIDLLNNIDRIAEYGEPVKRLLALDHNDRLGLISSANWQREIGKLFRDKVHESLGVCCFCGDSTQKELLMWSHYADSHKGLCIVFDAGRAFTANLHKVTYTREIPEPFRWYEYDFSGENFRYFLSKSWPWRYEDEYRLVCPNAPNSKVYFNKESLLEVRFGLRASTNTVSRIVLSLQNNGYANVKMVQMQRSKEHMSLTPEPLFRRSYGDPIL